ncbi:MAG: erythromycin biosynthesis sensory transduction protein eryC1 [Candidatus Chisholmbacteria bacterium RIFCSPHIGHO2_01_FULL_49_18]|uniref:Erythromycin biosynthesis sensory transduction protein eryC1 n=2 Tax=Candidatus Chisholmiibacteriota TaxID=1817900 RepID=A0A1G1VNH8_9BACT|nr:MAG: erythromycin biosynthesis sensory transduction protein eryC1 [Candidatus Chisholmbacteria bacterium RIFCSPHIGHO2_01_FULL_49_18]OGY21561.1 MAG: erythromycin biosynthesis sensory transduction protein eryC1 [Candidatus Chisholmbacteria bacterium RIFCSPLOWO2_01_FULL_49_14]
MILCSDPKAQYLSHKREIDEAIRRVLLRGRYILGKKVDAFEHEFARFLGTKFAVGVASGTDALEISMAALGIGKGDEVITASHTATATAAAILKVGAVPVLIDIEPKYMTLDPHELESAMSRKTRAVIPVHLYGQPADHAPIRRIADRRGIAIIEDCAQAHGALYRGRPVGTFGALSAFSFYPTKNLGAFGDAGAVVTDNLPLARQCRSLREYGWKEKHRSVSRGWNSRLDELQAAVLRVKLKHLKRDNRKRQALADEYRRRLVSSGVIAPKVRPGSTHVYHLYVVRTKARNSLQAALKRKGIQSLIHYPLPIHLQPYFKTRVRSVGKLPETERAAREVLSLPMYPQLTKLQLHTITDSINEFFA